MCRTYFSFIMLKTLRISTFILLPCEISFKFKRFFFLNKKNNCEALLCLEEHVFLGQAHKLIIYCC